MKKSILIFGLIVLVGLAAMCATPGSNQQPVKTPSPEPSPVGEILVNEKNSLNGNSYRAYRMALTKEER